MNSFGAQGYQSFHTEQNNQSDVTEYLIVGRVSRMTVC